MGQICKMRRVLRSAGETQRSWRRRPDPASGSTHTRTIRTGSKSIDLADDRRGFSAVNNKNREGVWKSKSASIKKIHRSRLEILRWRFSSGESPEFEKFLISNLSFSTRNSHIPKLACICNSSIPESDRLRVG